MRKKGGKWPHLLSWKLASSENVFGARGWPVNGVNANEHNEGRGSASVPISSIRWSTTSSRLFKSPSSGLLTSNSPCRQSLTGQLMMFEWVLIFVYFVLFQIFIHFSVGIFFQSRTDFDSSRPIKCGNLSCFCIAWPQVMILNFPKPVIWTSHFTGIKGQVFAITISSEVSQALEEF